MLIQILVILHCHTILVLPVWILYPESFHLKEDLNEKIQEVIH
jgi:hypothetical protein